jgi:hypothetical protein
LGWLSQEEILHRLGKILQDVPAICRLLGLRSTEQCASCIITSTIPADDFHPGMGQEPLGQRFGFSIRQ